MENHDVYKIICKRAIIHSYGQFVGGYISISQDIPVTNGTTWRLTRQVEVPEVEVEEDVEPMELDAKDPIQKWRIYPEQMAILMVKIRRIDDQ